MDPGPAEAYVRGVMLRFIRILALLLIVALGSLWAAAWFGRGPGEGLAESFLRGMAGLFGTEMPPPAAGGVQVAPGVTLGGPFTLVDHTGRTVTEADFAGRFMLIYFGFTFCPDICPTELGTIASAIDLLEGEGERVTPVFITVDPERDTPEAMADYVSRFHPRMVGLTGSAEQIAAAARAYRVYYAKAQRPEMSQYLMDHSSFIYLTGPDGRVRSLFRPETSPESIASSIRTQLRGS